MSESRNTLKSIAGGALSSLKGDGEFDKAFAGRIQPQAIELEEAVLGAIMIDKDAMPSVVEILKMENLKLKLEF